MKQLGVLDTAFINLEQTNTPQHIGGLGIYDPSTAPGGFVRFKQVIANFERRLNRNPLFRTRLVEVPGGFDRPYWVKDANFDVEFHLRHIALPQPGDWRQLCIQVARLHSRPLDMSRPLWEAYIIEGLDNIPNLPSGCFAIYTKMHHSMVDGAGGSSFMALLHDLEPDPVYNPEDDAQPRIVDTEPSMAELLTRASVNGVKNSWGLLRSSISNAKDMGKYIYDIAREEIPAPDMSAPKTLLNKPVGPHRVFDAAEFPLQGFKDIKDAGKVTINDVALTIIGGALSRYLDAKGERIAGSLAASMPLNMRARREASEDNNQVGAVFASMHTDIKDPIARLQAVHSATQEAKDSGESSPMVDILKLAGAVTPFIAKGAARLWSRNNLSQHVPMNISTVVSNVAGPNFPLYSTGARMVDYYGLGVLTPGMGIFHLVFSYSGKISLSVLADRDIMPDPELYHDCLEQAFNELYEAAVSKPAEDAAKAGGSKRKKAANSGAARKPSKARAATQAKAKTKAKTKAKASAKRKAPRRTAKATGAQKTTATKSGKAGTRRRAGKPQLSVVPKLKSAS
ncbi:MAG: wax ester/triacylglycerol synthase family O-acyltransferase [Halieaceae bacterium]|nr:wax ester/triacylglycerol synthase family O-acyltransferase [Halieaceae bacterium]